MTPPNLRDDLAQVLASRRWFRGGATNPNAPASSLDYDDTDSVFAYLADHDLAICRYERVQQHSGDEVVHEYIPLDSAVGGAGVRTVHGGGTMSTIADAVEKVLQEETALGVLRMADIAAKIEEALGIEQVSVEDYYRIRALESPIEQEEAKT